MIRIALPGSGVRVARVRLNAALVRAAAHQDTQTAPTSHPPPSPAAAPAPVVIPVATGAPESEQPEEDVTGGRR